MLSESESIDSTFRGALDKYLPYDEWTKSNT